MTNINLNIWVDDSGSIRGVVSLVGNCSPKDRATLDPILNEILNSLPFDTTEIASSFKNPTNKQGWN